MNKQKSLKKKANFLIRKGIKYFQNGNYEKSRDIFNLAIELNTNIPKVYIYMALLSELFDEDEKSLENYSTAIKLCPNNFLYYEYRGLKYSGLGIYDLAIEDFTSAIKLKPDNFKLYCERGIIYSKMKLFNKAVNDFNTAINTELIHVKVDSYIFLGRIYNLQKDYEQAISYYTKSINISKNASYNYGLIKCYKERAEIYLNIGDKQKSDLDLENMNLAEIQDKKIPKTYF